MNIEILDTASALIAALDPGELAEPMRRTDGSAIRRIRYFGTVADDVG